MARGIIGYLELELYLPGVASLKEKRSILKSILNRMRNQFNVASAEVGHQDVWQSALIAVTTVSNSSSLSHQITQSVVEWLEQNYPDVSVTREKTEII